MDIGTILRLQGPVPTNLAPNKFYSGTIFFFEDDAFLFYAGGNNGYNRATYISKINIGAGSVNGFNFDTNTLTLSGGPITRTGTIKIDLIENLAVVGQYGSSTTIPIITANSLGFVTRMSEVQNDTAGGTVTLMEMDSDDLEIYGLPTQLPTCPPPAVPPPVQCDELTELGFLATDTKPADICISPDDGFLYVANNGSISIYKRITGTGLLQALSPVNISGIGNAITISSDGKNIYVTNDTNSIDMFWRNTTNGLLTSIGTIATGNTPVDMCISADGKNVYAVNLIDDTISVFGRDDTTGLLTSLGDIAAGTEPNYIAVSPDGKNVYVIHRGSASRTISIYARNPTSGLLTITTSIATGVARGIAISPNDKNVYVTDLDNVIVNYDRNTTTGLLTKKETFASNAPWGIVISADGTSAYVSSMNNSISIFRRNVTTGSFSAVGQIAARGGYNLCISYDGLNVYVPNVNLDSITMYSRKNCTPPSTPTPTQVDLRRYLVRATRGGTAEQASDVEYWSSGDGYGGTTCMIDLVANNIYTTGANPEFAGLPPLPAFNSIINAKKVTKYSAKPYDTYAWKKLATGHGIMAAVKTDGSLWVGDESISKGTGLRKITSFKRLNNGVVVNVIPAPSNFIDVRTTKWPDQSTTDFVKLRAFTSDGATYSSSYGWNTSTAPDTMTLESGPGGLPITEVPNYSYNGYTHYFDTYLMTQTSRRWVAYGNNTNGQCGTSTIVSPIRNFYIKDLDNALVVSAGQLHTMAILPGGILVGCGDSTQGQLGNNSKYGANSKFTQIGTDRDWKSVYAGDSFSIAIKNDGTAYATGFNPPGLPVYSNKTLFNFTKIPNITGAIEAFGFNDPFIFCSTAPRRTDCFAGWSPSLGTLTIPLYSGDTISSNSGAGFYGYASSGTSIYSIVLNNLGSGIFSIAFLNNGQLTLNSNVSSSNVKLFANGDIITINIPSLKSDPTSWDAVNGRYLITDTSDLRYIKLLCAPAPTPVPTPTPTPPTPTPTCFDLWFGGDYRAYNNYYWYENSPFYITSFRREPNWPFDFIAMRAPNAESKTRPIIPYTGEIVITSYWYNRFIRGILYDDGLRFFWLNDANDRVITSPFIVGDLVRFYNDYSNNERNPPTGWINTIYLITEINEGVHTIICRPTPTPTPTPTLECGKLTLRQTSSFGGNHQAMIVSEKYEVKILCTADAVTNAVSVFVINADGSLTFYKSYLAGLNPRDIAMSSTNEFIYVITQSGLVTFNRPMGISPNINYLDTDARFSSFNGARLYISPDNSFLYISILNAIKIVKLNGIPGQGGIPDKTSVVLTTPIAGEICYMLGSSDGKYLYHVSSDANKISAFLRNSSNGSLILIRELNIEGTEPRQATFACSEKFIFISSIGTSLVSAFIRDPASGDINYASTPSTSVGLAGTKTNGIFATVDNSLYIADFQFNTLYEYKIDSGTGNITESGQTLPNVVYGNDIKINAANKTLYVLSGAGAVGDIIVYDRVYCPPTPTPTPLTPSQTPSPSVFPSLGGKRLVVSYSGTGATTSKLFTINEMNGDKLADSVINLPYNSLRRISSYDGTLYASAVPSNGAIVINKEQIGTIDANGVFSSLNDTSSAYVLSGKFCMVGYHSYIAIVYNTILQTSYFASKTQFYGGATQLGAGFGNNQQINDFTVSPSGEIFFVSPAWGNDPKSPTGQLYVYYTNTSINPVRIGTTQYGGLSFMCWAGNSLSFEGRVNDAIYYLIGPQLHYLEIFRDNNGTPISVKDYFIDKMTGFDVTGVGITGITVI